MDELKTYTIIDSVTPKAKRTKEGQVIRKTVIGLYIQANDSAARYFSDKAFELVQMVRHKDVEDPKIPVDGSSWALDLSDDEEKISLLAWAEKAIIRDPPDDESLPVILLSINCTTEKELLWFLVRNIQNAIHAKFKRRQMEFFGENGGKS